MIKKSDSFTEEELKSFARFGSVLQRIHARLIMEGYVVKDGHITKPPDSEVDEKSKSRIG